MRNLVPVLLLLLQLLLLRYAGKTPPLTIGMLLLFLSSKKYLMISCFKAFFCTIRHKEYCTITVIFIHMYYYCDTTRNSYVHCIPKVYLQTPLYEVKLP